MKWWMLVLLFSGAAIAQSGPSTKPAFTIGKNTTVVDGPLRPDGTLNYVPAINALIGGEVKSEDNAAIPFLLLHAGSSDDKAFDAATRDTLVALHVEVPAKPATSVHFLEDYLTTRNG